MQFSCLQPNLETALDIVAPAVARTSSLPVTQHVLIEADGGNLRLSSNNLETAINTNCVAMIEEPGAVTVPHKTLADLVKSKPSDHRIDISLAGAEDNETVLIVSSGRSVTHINGAAARDFPPPITVKDGHQVEISPADLNRAITLLNPSTAKDASRPVLQGINIVFEPERMTLAAADGFRLSVFRQQLTLTIEDDVSAIVPSTTMRTIARLTSGQTKPVQISIATDGSSVLFETENAQIRSQLIAGTYPNWEQLVPDQHETSARIATNDFQKICRTAEIFAVREDTNMIRLQIKNAGGEDQPQNEIVASSSNQQVGDYVESISAEIDGPDNKIAFNNRYLRELANILPNGDIRIDIKNESSPAVFMLADSEEFLQVIMPMYTAW